MFIWIYILFHLDRTFVILGQKFEFLKSDYGIPFNLIWFKNPSLSSYKIWYVWKLSGHRVEEVYFWQIIQKDSRQNNQANVKKAFSVLQQLLLRQNQCNILFRISKQFTNMKCLLMLWKMFPAFEPTHPIMSVIQLHMACQLVKPCTRNQKKLFSYGICHVVQQAVSMFQKQLLPNYVTSHHKNCYLNFHSHKNLKFHTTKCPIVSYFYIWQDKIAV